MTDEQQNRLASRLKKVPSLLILQDVDGVKYQVGTMPDENKLTEILLVAMVSNDRLAASVRAASMMYPKAKEKIRGEN